MRVNLYIPWRSTDDRYPAYVLTVEKLLPMYPWNAVYSVDSGHPSFNRAATRNVAFRHALETGVDVVVCCDADSIPEASVLLEAIAAAPDGLFHFPFDIVWYLGSKAIERVRQGQHLEQLKSRIIDKCESEGGIWVCQPETWWKAGGMDDGILYWGCDDRAFLSASRTMVGMPVKHQGVLLCLPHYRPTDVGEPVWHPPDVELLIKYQEAYMKPEEMEKLINERRTYLSGAEQIPTEERRPIIRELP